MNSSALAKRLANKAKVERLKREKAARGAKSGLLSFVQYLSPSYQAGWVHKELASALQWFLEEVNHKHSPRLMVFMPPRHGKSELVSRYFPAWAMGHNPNLTMIAASYSSDLSSQMNRDVQRIIDNPFYSRVFEGVGLFGKNIRTVANGSYLRNSDIFEIVGHRGIYRSAGVGGGITGMGADILNIDDPVKNAQEANSSTVREGIWDWYTNDAYTRLAPGGGVMLTMTRWHVDDLAGRLLAKMKSGEGDQWRVINFPAIASADEAHRKKGEPLHPERWSLKFLEAIKKTVGEYTWSALYQQSPTIPGGSIIKKDWWRWYDFEEQLAKNTFKIWKIGLTADTAYKKGEDNDYSALQAWCFTPDALYLLDGEYGKWNFPELKRKAQAFHEKWQEFQPNGRLTFWIEDKASGSPLVDTFLEAGINAEAWKPNDYRFPNDKVGRMNAAGIPVEAGHVYLPKGREYSNVLVDEAAAFTWNDSHLYDDNCDAFTIAVSVWEDLGGKVS